MQRHSAGLPLIPENTFFYQLHRSICGSDIRPNLRCRVNLQCCWPYKSFTRNLSPSVFPCVRIAISPTCAECRATAGGGERLEFENNRFLDALSNGGNNDDAMLTLYVRQWLSRVVSNKMRRSLAEAGGQIERLVVKGSESGLSE
jgi:hypothetical protein